MLSSLLTYFTFMSYDKLKLTVWLSLMALITGYVRLQVSHGVNVLFKPISFCTFLYCSTQHVFRVCEVDTKLATGGSCKRVK